MAFIKKRLFRRFGQTDSEACPGMPPGITPYQTPPVEITPIPAAAAAPAASEIESLLAGFPIWGWFLLAGVGLILFGSRKGRRKSKWPS